MGKEEVAKSALTLNNHLFQRGDSEGLKLFGSLLDEINNTLLELRAKQINNKQ